MHKQLFNIKKSDARKFIIIALLAVVLIAAFVFIGLTPKNYSYALSRRLPKIYTMIMVGGMIGFSSLIFQTVTNNHILTPSVLGLDSLYMLLNTALVFFLGSTNQWIVNANSNFIITLVVMLGASVVFYQVIFKKRSQNIFFILLVGIVVGTLFESFTTFLQVLTDPTEFLTVQDKSQASFNNINTNVLWLSTIIVILTTGYSMRYFKVLDVMALGRDHAINLGVAYDKTVKKLLVVVVILTAVATALVGPITFLGLLVVNIARYFIESYKHSHLSLAIWLLSIVALVGGQLLVERVLNFGISVSIIINFIGGIYFIYLLMKGRTEG
ncbi:MAG: iron chelate uptake ABC transporter family permease subunit [Candidatus Cellulosilyticum pullistercoris]|uniref:Iron chelate uptake ABC transporter family permease subunit n=1 Tax=Candidatus Cellulosilyticum pullistercoris TaxID=2838521 RepID=A0A9E2KBV6_9FIRM|nr:iron chelate uptake ABC transporter family permease subunit [Candidatus Cellulosilyticum pullistercoris]